MNNDKLINVVLVEDDAVIRHALETIINRDSEIAVVKTFDNAEECLMQLGKLHADLLLLDIQLPGMSGIDAVSLIKRDHKNCIVLMLTVFDQQDVVVKALKNGADGYITKNAEVHEIVTYIKQAFLGKPVLTDEAAGALINSLKKNVSSPLTKKETAVLEILAEGKTRNSIAQLLNIESETVKTHVRNIYIKLDVHSKEEAIEKARLKKYI
jgi:DNA-binding NarL/FixJ family response regulator